MASTRPLRTRRSFRLAVICAVALIHLGLFFYASTWRRPEPQARIAPSSESFPVSMAEPSAARPPKPEYRPEPLRKRKDRRAAAGEAPAAGPPAPPGPPAAGAQAHGGQNGSDLPDPWAVQEALRASVGCAMEGLKLRPDEQDRCDHRLARWGNKGRKIGPAEDDPKRAAALAAEEDYARRYHDWKYTEGGGTHNGDGMLDAKGALGPIPPKKPPQ
jgi:hypothetical protein